MTVTVRLFATLRLALGRGVVTVDAEGPITVRALLDRVSTAVGSDVTPWLLDDEGKIDRGTMILVGGRNVLHLAGLETEVDAAEVAVFPPAGGG